MASKFVRSVKDIYHLENFNTNLLDENDICSTVDGDVYIYTKNGFLLLESIEPLQDEVQEVQEKLSDNEQRIYNNEEKIKVIETSVNNNESKLNEEKIKGIETSVNNNEEKIKVIETSVEDNKLKVSEVNEKLDNIHLDELEKRIDSINIDELKQKIDSINIEDIKKEQETLSKKIDEKTNETNKKIKSNTDKINAINIEDTGWQDINLNDGYSLNAETPQYRITTINGIKMIDLRGGVSGIKENKKQTVGNIPLIEDLSNRHYFIQNTSMKNDNLNYGRWVVETNGDLKCYGSTDKELTGDEWFSIATSWKD